MPSPTTGLARVTVRAPRRRLDLVLPDQVPLAEILPQLLRRAGELGQNPAVAGHGAELPHRHGADLPAPGDDADRTGGWSLRRADGAVLAGAMALAHQGVRDGDVLYLAPRGVDWPEPAYDDVVEAIVAVAARLGPAWGAAATRRFALGAGGFVLLVGLVSVLAAGPPWTVPALAAAAVAMVLVTTGVLISRALGDGVAGAAAAGFALPFAAVSGVLALAGSSPLPELGAGHLLVGSSALLLACVVGAVGVGYGLRVFAAGVSAGLFGSAAAILALIVPGAGAAAILLVALVAGVGMAPILAVRLGKLPVPVVSAAPEDLAAEARPEPSQLAAAVARADEILTGTLLGIATLAVGCAGVLAAAGTSAGRSLAALGCLALLLRARLFPSVAARLPLLSAGLLGLAVVAGAAVAHAGPWLRLFAVAVAAVVVVATLAVAVAAVHRRVTSPYLSRLGDVLDVAAVVALAPVAFAALDLYSWMRGLAG